MQVTPAQILFVEQQVGAVTTSYLQGRCFYKMRQEERKPAIEENSQRDCSVEVHSSKKVQINFLIIHLPLVFVRRDGVQRTRTEGAEGYGAAHCILFIGMNHIRG